MAYTRYQSIPGFLDMDFINTAILLHERQLLFGDIKYSDLEGIRILFDQIIEFRNVEMPSSTKSV